ncbi:MAG: DUF2281 domain-containing protein [Lewinellaceae bacterium]|nr:DUF2281 domain-containing protein [Lewinella sp.]MCB9279272.1 DUF2281 domain-containing protein [Lewinellaceae bacterium]
MNDQLILSEIHKLPENLKLEVLHFIEFLKKEYGQKKLSQTDGKRVFGISQGRYKLAPDFDAPLDDFKDYMQ